MPIPSTKEYSELKQQKNAKELIFDAYKDWGWLRTIEFQWITWVPTMRMPLVTRYMVYAKDIPCSCPTKGEATMLLLTSSGVVITCAGCRTTSGHLDKSAFRVESEEIVSLADAEKVCRESGQKLPLVIKNLLQKKRGVFQIWS